MVFNTGLTHLGLEASKWNITSLCFMRRLQLLIKVVIITFWNCWNGIFNINWFILTFFTVVCYHFTDFKLPIYICHSSWWVTGFYCHWFYFKTNSISLNWFLVMVFVSLKLNINYRFNLIGNQLKVIIILFLCNLYWKFYPLYIYQSLIFFQYVYR